MASETSSSTPADFKIPAGFPKPPADIEEATISKLTPMQYQILIAYTIRGAVSYKYDHHEKLNVNGSNYATWQGVMQMALKKTNSLHAINDTFSTDDTEVMTMIGKITYDRMCDEAFSLLMQLVDGQLIKWISTGDHTARTFWKSLQSRFEKDNSTALLYQLQAFNRQYCSLEEDVNLEQFLIKFDTNW